MRRSALFTRIFLWFWGLTILMVVVNVLLAAVFHAQGFQVEFRQRSEETLHVLEESLWHTRNRDPGKVRERIEQFTEILKIRAFLLDSQDRDLYGDAPPRRAVELAALAREAGEVQRFRDGRVDWFAEPMGRPGGRDLILVGRIELPPPPILRLIRPGPLAGRLLLLLPLSGVVCFALARSIVRPLSRLRLATQAVTGGELATRVEVSPGSGGDELDALARDFNRMAERIESLIESEKRLLRDISHELRSPLARLTVALELARQRAGEEARKPLDRIEIEAERINQMVGQLLTLLRLESGMPRRNVVRVDLAALLQRVVEDADYEGRGSGRAVRSTDLEPAWVTGTADLLASALENILRNAIRHGEEGTEVEVALQREGEAGSTAVVLVRDHGPGVAEDALEDIFRPFYRVEDARERSKGGTGLGLAISRQAARLHGGDLTARNHPDGGLVVELRLPVTETPDSF